LFVAAAHHAHTALQVIYHGKTYQSLPPVHPCQRSKSAGWHLTSTSNHWSNLVTMKAMVTNIIEPYGNATAARLGLPDTQKVWWIIDVWSVHVSEAFRTFLKGCPLILVLFVPPNCTSKLQPGRMWQC
jgi:hypothetical protein